MILLDVGVWLAGLWGKHPDHEAVQKWRTTKEESLAFCRVTQMGLLRLLTNPSVLREDTLSRARAWDVLDSVSSDDRVTFLDEPAGLQLHWRALSARDDKSHKLWTDDYLAAFALASGAPFATLDRAVAGRYLTLRVETVGASPAS